MFPFWPGDSPEWADECFWWVGCLGFLSGSVTPTMSDTRERMFGAHWCLESFNQNHVTNFPLQSSLSVLCRITSNTATLGYYQCNATLVLTLFCAMWSHLAHHLLLVGNTKTWISQAAAPLIPPHPYMLRSCTLPNVHLFTPVAPYKNCSVHYWWLRRSGESSVPGQAQWRQCGYCFLLVSPVAFKVNTPQRLHTVLI